MKPSHLDSEREREISQVLQHLKITRINIAHRSELAGRGCDAALRGARMGDVDTGAKPGYRPEPRQVRTCGNAAQRCGASR
jgi:hypothetical protein